MVDNPRNRDGDCDKRTDSVVAVLLLLLYILTTPLSAATANVCDDVAICDVMVPSSL